MPALNALDFESAKVELGDNFLLLGSDAFLTDLVTDHVRIELKQKSDADLVIIYGDEARSAQINDLLDTYSIFSSAKLIIFRNAEALKKEELDCLAAYFQSPSEQQSLVVVAEKIDARVSGWKKIKDACQNVICDPPRYSGLMAPWLDRTLAKMGKTMAPAAKSLFVNRVELDYANANNELAKLVILTGDKKQISQADVMRGIGSSRVGTKIDFFRALGKRQVKDGLVLLDRMLASEFKPLQVLSMLNQFFLSIYLILLLKKNHISSSEISSKYLNDLFPSQRPEFLGFANNYTLPQMRRVFSLLLDTDSKIKTSMGSDAVLLTTCILKIMETA
ncbi:MAG: DNA polymerase III subunit delta [Candidatus Syntrophosphaera sp.]|nr:DNA polymerase III subunit delta [Candidatus Syntrophosphaera sp.]